MGDPVDLLDPEYAMPGELDRYEAQWRDVTPDAPAGRTVRHVWVDGALHTQTNTLPPMTGPEMAAMRADSMEQRIAVLEAAVSELGRRLEGQDRLLAHMAGLLHRQINSGEQEPV